MSAPTGQPVFSTTLGEGFKLLAKAVVAIAEQLKIANQLTAIRMAGLQVAQRDIPQYHLVREQLGMDNG